MIQCIAVVLLAVSLLIPAIATAGTTLRGKVMLGGTQHELTPAEGVMVTLEETGDSEQTKAGGLFNLPLSDVFGAGERITLQVDKEGWRIQYPLDGELRVPEPTEHQRIAIRLLPLGSKKWWSDDRIEKFIADTAARAKEQVAGDTEKQVPHFGRYIKEWALQYGFGAEEARAEIERWVAEVQQKEDDFYKLGLAAFAEKNFGKAEWLFRESAAVNAQRMRESERRIEAEKQRAEDYREATIRDYRLAGDAAYNDYAFTNALDAYRAALDLTDRDQRPRQWAEVTMDAAKANYAIGIRTEGPAVRQRLAQAVAAYRAALEVYTRALLPQQWAATQNNLGTALSNQGTRTGGEEGRRLLAEALDAFRGALGIYQAAGAGHYVQVIERNIALTELFVSGESDPDAQFTLGVLHARGQAVAQDADTKAVQWLRKAAVQGHGQAQLFLGVMVLSGRGVDQDDISGYAWIHLSAENGLEEAVEMRGQLQAEMEPSKRQEAQRLSERLLQVEGENKPETRPKENRPED
jgi:TPR repeat protein